MRWRGERESSNIEDRRGVSVGRVAAGGGLGTLVIMILALLFGVNPSRLLEQLPSDQQPVTQSSRPRNAEEAELKQFVAVVLGKTEDVWSDVFRKNGRQYREPTLVLFTDRCNRPVELRARQLDHSIVRVMRRFISTSRFTRSCDVNSTPPAISRRPTSSRTKSAITCRNFSESRTG